MAKKKVNKKFLAILTIVLGGLAIAGVAVVRVTYHTSGYFLNKSAAEEAKGNLPGAAAFLKIASNKDRTNKALYVRLGEMNERLVKVDPAYMNDATRAYHQAIELDPTYTPALDHLLGLAVRELNDGATGASFFTEFKRLADLAVASDGANARYRIYSLVAAVQQWAFGGGQPNAAVEKQIDELSKLAEQNPQESDAAYYASVAQMRVAGLLRAGGKAKEAQALLDGATARHEATTKARPQDPAVQWRAGQVYAQLAGLDDRADRTARYEALAKDAITAARDAAKPADAVFGDVRHLYAVWLRARNAPHEEVEKAYRDWTAAAPHDARARLELADYLGTLPGRRAEAIALLSTPVPPDPDAKGYAILRARDMERGALVLLNNFRAQEASAAPAGKDRDALVALIDADLPKINAMARGEDAPYLKLRGKSQMLHGNTVDAVKSFERANTLMGRQLDFDLWAQLQRAYVLTGQTGTAQQMTEDLLARAPGLTDMRLKLAGSYLSVGNSGKAAEHLKFVQANMPTDPALKAELSRLSIQLMAQQGQAAPARQQMAAMPESTRDEKLLKARMAAGTNDMAEATRLLTAVLKDDPGDREAVTGMVDVLLAQNNRSGAVELVNNAVKAKPDDRQLALLKRRISISSAAEFRKYQDETVAAIADPLTRAVRQGMLSVERGEFDEARKHLDEAEKIKPGDNQVLIARMQLLLKERKFDEAAPLVERIARDNADRIDGLSVRTQFALQRGDAAAAIRYGNELVGKYGEFAANWLWLGQAQQAVGQYREALASFDQALQRQPNNVDAMRNKALCYEATGQYAEERSVIDRARVLAPSDSMLRDLSLNWDLRHGDPDGVVATCKEILAREPENPAVYAALGQAAVASAQTKHRGDAAAAKALLELARDKLREGMIKFGATPEVVRFYVPMATTLEALGDPAAALEVLGQYAARPEMKDKPDALREIARLYERQGRAQEAEKSWRDAYGRSAKNVDLQLEFAQFLQRQGRGDDALKTLAEANADNPRVQSQQIETLMGTGRLPEATQLVEKVYGSTPSTAAGLFFRGIIRLTRNEIQPALNDLGAARDKDPQNPSVRLWLARGLLRAGRGDEAAAQLEEALRRSPLREDLRMQLLDAYSGGPSPRWADYDRVIKEALDSPPLAVNPVWHQLNARGLAARRQFDAAKQEVAAAQKLAPNSLPLRDEYVNILVQAKEWPAVISETDQELAQGHKAGFVYGKRGLARAGLGDKAAALVEFDEGIAAYQAAKNSAGVIDLIRTMGGAVGADEALARTKLVGPGIDHDLLTLDLYGMKGDWSGQATAAEALLAPDKRLNPQQRAEVLHTAADAYIVLQDWKKAKAAFDELLTIRTDDVVSLANAAYLVATIMHTPADAKPYSTRAYNIAMKNGGMPKIVDTHGWVMVLCGGRDAVEGRQILQNLVTSNQDFTKARYHLAEAYLREGDWKKAGDELAVVQKQMSQMDQNHQAPDDELKTGVPKALEQVRQKSGQASGAAGR